MAKPGKLSNLTDEQWDALVKAHRNPTLIAPCVGAAPNAVRRKMIKKGYVAHFNNGEWIWLKESASPC